MPAQIFGTDAVVTILNRAFTDTSPANATFKNQVATAGTTRASQEAFAVQFGSGYAGQTSAQLSNLLLKNLGVLPNAGLEAALTDYITAAGKSNVGLIALQLGEILSNLENDTNGFAAAAVAWNSEVTAAYNYSSNPANTTPSGSGSGVNLVLTTGVDIINGTSADDTIIADQTGASPQLSAADQINGGAGNDTLKVFLKSTDTATGQPSALTAVENVWLNGGVVAAYTAAAGTTGLTVEAPFAPTAATYTVNGQAVTLKSVVTANNTNLTTTILQGATATSQAVTLDGFKGTGTGVHTLDLSGASVATLNLTASGNASTATLANTGAGIRTVNVAGDKGLTLTTDAATSAAITTINASTATGAVAVDTSAGAKSATFKFTGGAGNDKITLAANDFTLLTSGAQLDGGAGTGDMIVIKDTTPAYAALNKTVNFEVLGIGTTATTVDAAQLTSIKSFSTGVADTTINNLGAGSSVAVTGATTTVALGAALGNTATDVTIGSATGAGFTTTSLTATGLTTLGLTVNGTSLQTITTLGNSDNTTITIKGAADLKITNALAGTTTGSKVDASALTGKLTVTGSGQSDIIIGGTNDDLLSGGAGAVSDTLTGGAGKDKFLIVAGVSAATADVVTDFVTKTDTLAFGATAATSTNFTKGLAAVADFAAALAAANAALNTATVGYNAQQVGSDTWVFYNDGGAANADQVVKLTGVALADIAFGDIVAV